MIKIGALELPPLFMAGLRSLVASLCLYAWMKIKGVRLFPSKIVCLHGIVIGLFFALEFGFIYVGLNYTLASRVYILVYTAPFFTALGAHFFLIGDRLNPWKTAGLILAFTGIIALFMEDLGSFSLNALPGDMMALASGLIWGSETVYIKKYLVHRIVPLQTLFYEVFFSTPLLLLTSIVLEEQPILSGLSISTVFSLFYQCIIIAFLSFLVWFHLVHRYSVSLLHAFSFFTPVFGVFLSGALILGEEMSSSLIVSLILVCLGLVFANYRPKAKPSLP